jgi:threonyl-tRNA synthetase
VKVLLPDDTALELAEGATGGDAARAIGEGLARAALAVKVDGELRDLARPVHDGARIEIVTQKSPEALELIRHDAAHVLATAVRELYPGTKVSIGPPIEAGFYYDSEFPEGVKVSEDDFGQIEQKMREHIKAAEPFEREDIPAQDALKRFLEEGEDYKVELNGLALSQRPVHGPLPRAACADDQDRQGVQARVDRRRVLARRFEPPDADADLRHCVLLEGGAGGAPRASRAGARP